MKKEKKSKKSRSFIKLGLISVLSVVCCFGVILMASASSYSFYLQLNQGGTTWSTKHNFTAGINEVIITPTSFTKVDGLRYTKLRFTQYNTINGSESEGDYFDFTIYDENINNSRTYSYGYQSQNERRYKFTTNVDSYRYGGLRANVTTTSGN